MIGPMLRGWHDRDKSSRHDAAIGWRPDVTPFSSITPNRHEFQFTVNQDSLGRTRMGKHTAIPPAEAADRLAIRELVDAYAHCADRRDAKGQMSLFTEDTHFVVYMNAKDPTPSMELHSREALAPVFADLNKYDATTHFVGQSTILTLSADRGTGETYCLAHHVSVEGEKRRLMLASLRYLDTFVKVQGAWLFAERRLYVDWLEERAFS
jgi:hypothetical protein